MKVAKVIDDSNVIINQGELNGLKIGQRVLIYSYGDEIIDPENGQSLGRLEIVKGTGVIVHLQELVAHVASDKKSDSYKKIIRKPTGLFQSYFSSEEEVIDTKNSLPFNSPSVGDNVRFI